MPRRYGQVFTVHRGRGCDAVQFPKFFDRFIVELDLLAVNSLRAAPVVYLDGMQVAPGFHLPREALRKAEAYGDHYDDGENAYDNTDYREDGTRLAAQEITPAELEYISVTHLLIPMPRSSSFCGP